MTADAADDLFEYNHASHADAEGNNAGQLRFDSTIAPYPDLLADTIHVLPASPKSGERVTLQWTERNSGSAALGRDTYTRVRITQAGSGAVAHDQWLYFNAAANSSLIAGGVVQRQTHFTFPEGPAGAQFRSRPRRQSL